MTERTQELVLERLRPHRERLEELIQQGTPFLFTGNALELLGESIQKEGGETIPCLGLFPFTARRDMMHRHNSIFLGEFEGRPVMGFKSQFTMAYPKKGGAGPVHRDQGRGPEQEVPFEGVRRNHFFGTYLLGPLLVNNPPFTRSLLKAMGAGDVPLALEQAGGGCLRKAPGGFPGESINAQKPPQRAAFLMGKGAAEALPFLERGCCSRAGHKKRAARKGGPFPFRRGVTPAPGRRCTAGSRCRAGR